MKEMGDYDALPAAVLSRLRCPTCGTPVITLPGDTGVECRSGHRFERVDGVLDFSGAASAGGSTERTFASFGYEWNAFDDVRGEDESFAEVYFRDLDLDSLKGKIGLDAGCGKGRYTRFLAQYLDAEVALDGSSAAEAAARNLAGIAGTAVVRSDLRDAPFAPESFDFISSLGVLHHLDDPFAGFRQLLTLPRPQRTDPALPLQPARDRERAVGRAAGLDGRAKGHYPDVPSTPEDGLHPDRCRPVVDVREAGGVG